MNDRGLLVCAWAGWAAFAVGCGNQNSAPQEGAAGEGPQMTASSVMPGSSAPAAMQPSGAAMAGGSAASAPTGTSGSAAASSAAAGGSPAAMSGNTSAPAATSGATAGAGAAGAGAAMGAAASDDYPDLRGKCGIDSGYPGDETCLPPPAPEEGMQIHVGPKDYTNMDEVAPYLMHPGQESSECWTFHTPNDKPIYYQTFILSGRPGTHHIINTMYNTDMPDGGFGPCADPGTGTNGNIIDNLPGASKAYMPRGHVAPENEHLGREVPAHATAQADMHYYNFTDHDIIREFWMNIYYVPQEQVTEKADQIRAMGGLSWTVAPIPAHSDMTYSYSCPITGEGRIISLLGHYHSHGTHFTASIKRASGNTEKVFEMYDFLDPAIFEYDSVRTNPSFTDTAAGATSGMLEVHNGDELLWDCHIVNDSDVGLTYTNEINTGEMCNLWGESIGIDPINCVLP